MELSLRHKLCFSKSYIFGFQCRRPSIFQTMNSVRSNNISLKYQSFTALGFKDIGVIKSEFVAKTQFLCILSNIRNTRCRFADHLAICQNHFDLLYNS